jgi:purine-binding chemotaxis protein CheW
VIDTEELCVGLIVDNVAEVIGIDDENIVPPPPINAGACNRFMQGIGKVGDKISLLLDCKKLFIDEEIQILTNIN